MCDVPVHRVFFSFARMPVVVVATANASLCHVSYFVVSVNVRHMFTLHKHGFARCRTFMLASKAMCSNPRLLIMHPPNGKLLVLFDE